MDLFSAYPEIATLVNVFKYSVYALVLWLCTAALSGCGVSVGNSFVAGTTGYLQEHNQGKKISVEHTEDERKKLSMLINRR